MNKITVVYVFGPSKDYDIYMSGKSVEWVKIGMTEKKNPTKSNEDVAITRINGEARTGIPVLCKLYDVFAFPSNGKVDLQVRRKLNEIGYSEIDFSFRKSELDAKEIKPGTEFVYNINRNQVKHAIISYTYDLLMNCISPFNAENLVENAKSLYDVVSENFKIEDPIPEDELTVNPSSKGSRDLLPFWNKVKSYLKEYNLMDYGPYEVVNSKHPECKYCMAYYKRTESLAVYFESYAMKNTQKKIYHRKPKGDEVLKILIQDAINANRPSAEMCGLLPEQGKKRSDKWAWVSRKSAVENEDENAKWVAEKFVEMYSYFENLEF